MPRPNVTITTVDDSVVFPTQEGTSSLIAGYLDVELYPNNMLGSLGFTYEREQGYMTISSVGELHERLKTNQPTGYENLYENSDSGQVEIYPFFHFENSIYKAGNSYAGGTFERWPSGPDVKIEWKYDFALIENYLQYGGSVTIFSAKADESSISFAKERAKSKKINVDLFFSPFFSQNNNVREIVNSRQDCIAITSVPSEYKGGFGFGRSTMGPAEGASPSDFFPLFSGTTWTYVGSNYEYEDRGEGVLKYPLDNVYVKNTGDYSYPVGRNVFSVNYFDNRPKQGKYGSTAELISAMRHTAVGLNEESYSVRGCTFPSSLLSTGNQSGFTFATNANFSNNVSYSVGEYFYYNSNTDTYQSTTNFAWGVIPSEFKDQFYAGITYFQNEEMTIRPGRMTVVQNLCDRQEIDSRFLVLENGNLNSNLNIENFLLPCNFNDRFSWGYNLVSASYTNGYEQFEGKSTFLPGPVQGNQQIVSSVFDVKESFNPDFNPIEKMHGPDGFLPNTSKKTIMDIFYGSGQSADYFNYRTENNIFASSGASLSSTAINYWGCTCGDDNIGIGPAFGIRQFIGEISGVTPDICIDFGPKSTTSQVTADGSTYRAYIAFSRPFPDNTLTGLVNIYGEFIGPPSEDSIEGDGCTFSSLVEDKLSKGDIISKNPFSFTAPNGSNQIANGKSISIYPLVPDDSESGFALTADKENYFYTFSTTQHFAGAITAIDHYKDRNWPESVRRDTPGPDNFGPLDLDYSFHWYNANSFLGSNVPNAVGMIGSVGSTAQSQFYGITIGTVAPSSNQNGITAEGIYLLAEIDVQEHPNGIPTSGFSPTEAFNVEDVSYNNIFSSDADFYEFPVFGEKYSKDTYTNYASAQDSLDIEKANEIPFTSDVAGIFARMFRDTSPWLSPASRTVSTVRDIIAERYSVSQSSAEQDDLYDSKINYIRAIDGATRLFGDITFAGGTDTTGPEETSTFRRSNVVNTFIYLKKRIEPIARSVLFEQNDATTRNSFVNQVTQVLEGVKNGRGITDYKVVCDTTNNTPELIDANTFVADVFVKPTKSINYVRLRFTNTGAEFEF